MQNAKLATAAARYRPALAGSQGKAVSVATCPKRSCRDRISNSLITTSELREHMHHTRADRFVLISALLVRSLLAQSDVTDLIRRAVQLQQSGDFKGAAEAYRAVLKQRPDDVASHVNLGVTLVHLDQFDDAIAEYNAAAKLLPGDPRIELNLALAYQKSGSVREAAQRFEALHRSLPQENQITMLLADCHLQLGEDDKTIELLQPLERQNPDDLGLAYMLGMAL